MDEKTKEKQDELIEKVSKFCDKHLDSECKDLSIKMVKRLGELEKVPFKRGALKNWAAGIIYALAQTSFLFDKDFEPYITSKQIYRFFNTKPSTTGNKAKQIRELLDIEPADPEFSTEYVRRNSGFLRAAGTKRNSRSLRGSENSAILGSIADMFFKR